MQRSFFTTFLAGLIVGLLSTTAWAAKPPVPAEATGYVGGLEGTVKEKAPQNAWFVLSVSKAEPDAKSKVKDGSVLLGKDIPVSSRLAGNTPFPEQVAYIETLKVGDKVALKVRYNDNAGDIAIRLVEFPGGASPPSASPPSAAGKAKGASKGPSGGPSGVQKTATPGVPDEATGYVGGVAGTVKEKAPRNGWILLSVSKTEPDAKSKVKDGSVLVGKEIRVSARLSGDTPFPEQVAYFETLKVGDQVSLKVRYNDNAGNVAIRLNEVPGRPAPPGASSPSASSAKGKAKGAAKGPAGGKAGGPKGAKPPVPAEATGFVGSLAGTIQRKAPQNAWLVLSVSKAEPDAKSTIKDGSALVGKDIPVSARLSGNTPFPEQVAYIQTLKVGDKLTVKVFYNDNAGNIAIRLAEVPAGIVAPAGVNKSGGQPSGEITFPTQAALGNIFTVGQKVRIEAAVKSGASVEWTIRDFRGQQVATGTAPVTDRRIVIEPGAAGKGFYVVQLTAKSGGSVVGEAATSFAIVAPADVSKMADSKFAVVTHFAKTMPTDILPLVAKAGIAHVRDEQPWNQVEKEKGKYVFGKHEPYMSELSKAGLTPLIVMAFGSSLYDIQPKVSPPIAAPYTPEGCTAYANYCNAVLEQYGSQIKAAEIWNEYNGSFCGGKAAEDRPKYYTAMLQAAYTQIKAARPDVKVIGGAAVKIPLPYFEKLFKHGALRYMDGVAVHPYMPTPEGVERQTAALVELMKKYNNGQAKSIWVTEMGTWDDQSMERVQAASYLVRMYTLLLTQPEVERVYWYLLRDYAEFKNQGLVHGEDDPLGKYTPVASYAGYSNLVEQLHRAKFVRREPTDFRTRVYRFDKGNESVWVCWSTFDTAKLTFAATAAVRVVDLVGGEQVQSPANGQVEVVVGDLPVYVVVGKSAVTAVRETPRKDQVLADSVRDFSGTQGQGNWTYGYCASNRDGSAPYVPGDVKPMVWEASKGDWEDRWQGPAESFSIGEGNTHPAAKGSGQLWAVRRWTSDTAGQIHIIASVKHGQAKGNGVGCKVFLDGKELYSKLLSSKTSTDIDLSPTVQKGACLDFVVTPGPGLDTSFDATGLRITILTLSK